MSNAKEMKVLFKELCDEDIAYVSGGVTVSASSVLGNDGTGTATVTVNGQTATATLPSTNNPPPTNQPTTSPLILKKLFATPTFGSPSFVLI